MNKDKVQIAMAVVTCVGYLYFLYRLQEEHTEPDFPSREEILQAIENGAANLTVTPMTQSDN